MTEQKFEAILRQALHPEISPEETALRDRPAQKGSKMNTRKAIKKACLIAAVILLLGITTVCAADIPNIRSLVSGRKLYSSAQYADVGKAQEAAGFQLHVPEALPGGYHFEAVEVDTTRGLDENQQEQLAYPELRISYRGADGNQLILAAHAIQNGVADSDRTPDRTGCIGETLLNYRLDHYKFVPADYTLTPADQALLAQTGYHISYGSDTVEEQDVAFLSWQRDGVCCLLMDSGAEETGDALFAMAQTLLTYGT